jgi:hypothetical protein
MAKIIATENQEQRALVKWIRMQPRIRDYVVKLNNEGARTVAQSWNLKLMGMNPGASDLFLAYPSPNGRFHGLWLEVKRNKKYTESEMKTETWMRQAEFILRMVDVGYAGYFCFGWENGKRIIEEYLSYLS